MADAQHSAGQGVAYAKVCTKCGELKPVEAFRMRNLKCRRCINRARDRRGLYARMSPEQKRKQNERISAYRKFSGRHEQMKAKRTQYIEMHDDGTLTKDGLMALFASASICHYCRRPMRSMEKSLDHVLPLSRGGMHSLSNAVVCCKTCNSSKGNRTIDEWIGSMIHKSQVIDQKRVGPISSSTGVAIGCADFDSFRVA